MRYTTVIDLRDYPDVYRNQNARLVYLHLSLAAGYHDNNRDMVSVSIRNLSWQVGITVSACRHALLQLERSKLVSRDGDKLVVKKWCETDTISPRAKTAAQRKDQARAADRDQRNDQAEQQRDRARIERENLAKQGKNSWMIYYENRQARAMSGSVADQEWCRANADRYEENKKAMSAK